MTDFSHWPLINDEIVGELYLESEDSLTLELQQAVWNCVDKDLLQNIQEIRDLWKAGAFEEARKLSHKAAGYTGNAGLMRTYYILHVIDNGELPPEEWDNVHPQLEESAILGMQELLRRYPHLASGK